MRPYWCVCCIVCVAMLFSAAHNQIGQFRVLCDEEASGSDLLGRICLQGATAWAGS